ncbi:tetratricopeptide repeat protein [Variovorax sp. W6]|uniref:tetratricopeptide repeat protein n=1 Tax=Variovorax sp. W6 TaxID=3093895 RepID=UPI003D80575A
MADDARGRAMLSLEEVAPFICVPLNQLDFDFLVLADEGNADAQNDMGQLFSNAGKPKIALYWLEQAARQGHADAMQWLGRCYIGGEGVPRNKNIGLMWIAKAAAHGHVIAQAQMRDSFRISPVIDGGLNSSLHFR